MPPGARRFDRTVVLTGCAIRTTLCSPHRSSATTPPVAPHKGSRSTAAVTDSGNHPQLAPGSVVVVRDEEWFVRATEETADGLLVHVQGLGELVRDSAASFYAELEPDKIVPLD